MWDQARVGEVLAAVGNHEAKALTFLAMRDGVEYGSTAIYRRFLDIQGPSPAYAGTLTVARKYLEGSFAPAGLVNTCHDEHGWVRHIRHDPGRAAAALAGFLLGQTEHHPGALSRIYGKTGLNKQAAERAPGRRHRVLSILAGCAMTEELWASRIAERAGIREPAAAAALTSFAAAGLLDYACAPTYLMHSTYLVREPIDKPVVRGRPRLRDAVIDHLNASLAAAGRPVQVERNDIETAAAPASRSPSRVRDQVQRVMTKLADRGAVEAIASHNGPTHTTVAMTVEQWLWIRRLVEGVEAIAAADHVAIEAGLATGEAILADPARVRHLIAKAYGASKTVTDPITAQAKQTVVLRTVTDRPGCTSAELLVHLPAAVNKAALTQTLAALARKDLIRGQTQPDGPYKRWYPAPV